MGHASCHTKLSVCPGSRQALGSTNFLAGIEQTRGHSIKVSKLLEMPQVGGFDRVVPS